MRRLEINVPDDLDMSDYDFAMIIASKLYEEAKLSAGQAAELVGLSKRTFLELLGKYGVSIISNRMQDLHDDIANA
jgi:predicted HTH domain antitoxin